MPARLRRQIQASGAAERKEQRNRTRESIGGNAGCPAGWSHLLLNAQRLSGSAFDVSPNERKLTSIKSPVAKLWSLRLAFAEENRA